MEPIIKSEPCEGLYSEQDISNSQLANDVQRCEITLEQAQPPNILKRLYEGVEETAVSNRDTDQNQHCPNNSYYQPFEFASIPQNMQDCFNTQESIQTTATTADGKPLKKYKRLEANLLFNPPFFSLVDELQPNSNKDAILARCYSCEKTVKGNRGISSNFIKHMKRSHPEIYTLYDGYKYHKIKSYQLPNLAKMVTKKPAPVFENGASGSDSATANSNDDTNQFFETGTVRENGCINDSSDDNDDSITATKEIRETNDHIELSPKNLETLENLIDEKLKTFVKQKEYDQLNEKLNSLTDRCKTCDVGPSTALTELKTELDKVKNECSELRTAMQGYKASKSQLQSELQTVDKLLHQRKLIIRNIPVRDSTDPLKSVEKLFKETMKVDDVKIINCCIIPSTKTAVGSHKENVSVELASAQDCKAIFRQAPNLKNTGIFIETEMSPFQRKRKNKLMVLRKELLRRKPDLKVLVRDTTLVVNGKKFYWDDVEGLCHDCRYEAVDLNGVEYLKLLCGLDLNEFIIILQNYNVQIT